MRFGVEGHHTREYLHIADVGRGFIISGIEHLTSRFKILLRIFMISAKE